MSYRPDYNSLYNSYVPSDLALSALRKQVAKIRQGSATELRILGVGDSITLGTGATSGVTGTTRWGYRFPAALASKMGLSNLPLITYAYSGAPGFAFGSGWSAGSIGSGNAQGAPTGSGQAISTAGGTASPTVYTSQANCTGLNLYANIGSGTAGVAYAVDGGSVTTVAASGSLGDTTKIAITGLSSGIHTLSITNPAGGGQTFLTGVEEVNTAVSSVKSSILGVSSLKSTGLSLAGVAALAPHVVICCIGSNDASFSPQTSLSAYSAALQALVTKAATVATPPLFLFLTQPQPLADGGHPVSPIHPTVYYDLQGALAQANSDCAVLRIDRRFGTAAQAQAAGLMSDNFHPNDTGHGDMADALVGFFTAATGL